MLSQTRLSIIRNHRFPRVITSQRNSSSYAGNKVLGIVREKHGMWERRAPLSPNQVRKLLDDLPGSKVLIQPCTRRIFTNDQYSAAGAIITEDLSHANFILGVKSMKAEDLMPSKSYMFFSHTIKAQPYSMPLLDTILEKKVRLFDYECITKDGRDDTPRLVAFGGYAGRAGMIDGLQGLGLRLLAEGYSTPFLHMPNTYMHRSLNEVRDRLRIVGDMISSSGFPPALSPMVFAFTGTGNVAKGALEIFEHLPHEFITVKELPNLKKDIEDGKRPANKIYAVKLKTSDLVRHKTDPYKFSRDDYYRFPENYEPKFHETVLPHITMLVNGIYWDARFPRLLTKENIASLRKAGNHNFRAVADISCDIDGSVEFLSRPTSIENPFYMYNPEMDTIQDNVTSDGILMLGVDNLPTELPADATEHFGERLLPLLPPLLTSTDGNYENLPAELKRACIANNGSLTPKWAYISRLREQTSVLTNAATPTIAPKSYVRLEIMGHLFDTGLIIHVLDSLELVQEVNFSIINCEVRPNTSAGPKHSRFLIQLSGSDASKVKQVAENVRDLVAGHPFAEGSCHIHSDSVKHIDVRTPKRVLLFGAGRVAVPVAKLFAQKDNVHLTIATEEESQAKALMSYMPGLERSSFHPFKYPADIGILPDLIKSSDLVISLLPATMHAPLAAEATYIDGIQCTVTVHVDDLKVSCVDMGIIDQLAADLTKRFGNVNRHDGPILDYLGMTLDYSNQGVVRVSMPAMIDAIVEELAVKDSASTPANVNLFIVKKDSLLLENNLKEQFHSIVAKLLYLSKKARPDILTAVSYLTTRVKEPNMDDWNKMIRVAKYLHGSKETYLQLSAIKEISIHSFIDSSFAIHQDAKGHTGVSISLGKGAIYNKSSKQKLVSKSSTESELVGLVDGLPMVIWIRNFLINQGYDVGTAVTYQDNKSTMMLAAKGKPSSNRTRHINIRYFFVKDRMDSKEIKLTYLPTEAMIADFFTKPLQGSTFLKLRDYIMGTSDINEIKKY